MTKNISALFEIAQKEARKIIGLIPELRSTDWILLFVLFLVRAKIRL